MNSHTPFDVSNDWTLDPYHCNKSNDPLVDKIIGNAYHVVRAVYCNLGNLKLLYDFLNSYGMVLGVKSEDELKKLNKMAKYARIYGFASTGDRQVTDYLYVPDDISGIKPEDPTATGSWIKVSTSGTGTGEGGKGTGSYIPYVYANGSALGGETSFKVPPEALGVAFLIINGSVQYIGYGFDFNPATSTVTLSNPLVQGDEVIALTSAAPANPDNPDVPNWIQVNWLYNNGSAIGGEQVITVPYNFKDVPAVYKNGIRLYKNLQTESYTYDPASRTVTMTEILAQGDRVIVTLGGESATITITDRTVQEVARANNIKDSDVVLSSSTTIVVTGKKVIYDVVGQKYWAMPELPPNSYIVGVQGNQFTYNPGNVTVTLTEVINPADILKDELSTEAGTSLIGSPEGNLETRLVEMGEKIEDVEEYASINSKSIANNFISNIMPCSTPTVGFGVKAILKAPDDDDFFVVTRKANGKSGFIASRVTNEVAATDASNYGGSSPFRPGSVDNIQDAMVAKLVPSAKGAAVVLSSLTSAQISAIYGFNATGASIKASLAGGDFNLFSPQLYSIPNGSTVVYSLNSPRAVIRFAAYNTASGSVQISISRNGTDWMLVDTVNTLLPPAGNSPLPYDVNVNGLSGTWYLRIANAHANNAVLAGLNIMPLGGTSGSEVLDYDNFMATIVPDLPSGPAYYFGGQGATEFAAKEIATGKFFGTYHGGHTNYLQRLRTDVASYNLDTGTAPVLVLSKTAVLHSASDIVIGSTATYNYLSSTIFGDGSHTTRYSIKLASGVPVLCERIYTHMATTCRNFNWIHHPTLIQKEDDGDVVLGQVGFIQQFRAEDTAYIDCSFSQVNINNSSNGGYVSFQPNYNKQYYGPALNSSGYAVPEGTFTTCKSFY